MALAAAAAACLVSNFRSQVKLLARALAGPQQARKEAEEQSPHHGEAGAALL
jgi:hypothetical protein